MAVGFAGSRTLDERRRRRLAGGPEEDEARAESDAPTEAAETQGSTRRESGDTDAASRRADAHSSALPRHFPLRRIVSPRLWKHLLVALTGMLLGAGILAGGMAFTGGGGHLDAELNRLFALPHGPLVRGYVCLLFLLAGQLALLIRWGRSRSDSDFAGRYRVWGRVAAVWFLLAGGTAVDLPRLGQAIVSQTNAFDVTAVSSFWWSGPLLAGGLVLYRALHREMRACRPSLALLRIAGGLALLAAWFATREAVPAEPAVRAGLSMAVALSVFLSMLLHARHVIDTSTEAPAVPPLRARLRLWRRRCRPPWRLLCRMGGTILRLRGIRTSNKTTCSAENDKAKAGGHQASSTEAAERAENRTQSRREAATESRDERTGGKQTPDEGSGESKPSGKQLRADRPIDKDQLKGLSKRERRKLRKKWRDQQRAAT